MDSHKVTKITTLGGSGNNQGTAHEFADKLNSVSCDLKTKLLNDITLEQRKDELTPSQLVYIDEYDNCVYEDRETYKVKSFVTLRQFKIASTRLSKFLTVEREIPELDDGSYFFFKSRFNGKHCLASMGGKSEIFYIVIHENPDKSYPTISQGSWVYSFHRADIEGPVTIDSFEGSIEEFLMEITLGIMIMQRHPIN